MLQETWLDESVESLEIPNYTSISRKDRLAGAKQGYGGVAVYVRNCFDNLVELAKSTVVERVWLTLHTDIGTFLLGNWYRPPGGDDADLLALNAELVELSCSHVGILLAGDVNIHHSRWLRHSNGNTAMDSMLWEICQNHGLVQCVMEPTREPYLLDLILTDVSRLVKVRVLPATTDHAIVEASLSVPTASSYHCARRVWQYSRANWSGLRSYLRQLDWDRCSRGSVFQVASHVTTCILSAASEFIPRRTVKVNKGSHPWVNERCLAAIREKNGARGTTSAAAARQSCSDVLREEYVKYTQRLKEEIATLPKGSKRRWKLNRELLNKKASSSHLPTLKSHAGSWVSDPVAKADLLADAFEAKYVLPPACYRVSPRHDVPERMCEFVLVRQRWISKLLKSLDPTKSTGPDLLPGRVLRQCHKELAPVVTRLARRILSEACWPWKHHWLHPLFKGNGSTSQPGGYRGLHLTPVLSKIVERALGLTLNKHLGMTNAFGDSQWASRPKRNCRTLVTILIAMWLYVMSHGGKVGVYLSDIQAAFDRVDSGILLEKCERAGICNAFLRLLQDSFAPRMLALLFSAGHPLRDTSKIKSFKAHAWDPPCGIFSSLTAPSQSCNVALLTQNLQTT